MRSVENLHHFQCPHCDKWWSVADASDTKTNWYCPWCGEMSMFEVEQGHA